MRPKHILLCGDRGAGKSTLIQRFLEANTRPVYGFYTQRLAPDATGFHPIYLHAADDPLRAYTRENQVGACDSKTHTVFLEVFNGLGARCVRRARQGGLVVMDELGFLEAEADAFTQAVLQALDADIPVIAAVKARYDVPFLNDVRAHPNATVYPVDTENRNARYAELLPVIRAWNADK